MRNPNLISYFHEFTENSLIGNGIEINSFDYHQKDALFTSSYVNFDSPQFHKMGK